MQHITFCKKLSYVAMIMMSLLFSLCIVVDLVAQDETNVPRRRTVLTEVRLNSTTLPREKWVNLYLRREDTLSMIFRCIVEEAPKVPILFVKTLQRGARQAQTYSESNNRTSVRFTGLAEDVYRFEATAFAPREQWQALPVELPFTVNDSLANVQRRRWELDEALAERNEQLRDSLFTSFYEELLESVGAYRSPYIYVSLFFGGTTILALFFALWQKKKNINTLEQQPAFAGNEDQSTPDPIFNEVYMSKDFVAETDTLLRENHSLKEEVNALRSQIDVLQARTNELKKMNSDLRKQQSEVEKHRAHLEELQKQKDELFAMVVHDMKNPASLIKSMVELLKSYDLSAEEQNELMDGLLDTSNRIFALAQDVSRVIALESSSLNLDRYEVSLPELVANVCARNNIQAAKKDIKIVTELAENVPYVPIDPFRIEEVLDNLLSNAVKFSAENKGVKVKVYQKGANVVTEIIDEGPGLSEADLKKAFQRGAKLSARPTAGEGSSGLGLWIVRRIVEAHSGKVWVRSVIGKGSTFAFELPISM